MAKHDVKLQINAEIPVKNVDFVVPVTIDGNLRGRVEFSTGSIDWRPARHRRALQLSWARFAEIMEEHGTPTQ